MNSDPAPQMQPIRVRLGFGLNYRHAFGGSPTNRDDSTPLCAMAVFDLTNEFEFNAGGGPFCPSCLRLMTTTIPVPKLTRNEVAIFALAGVAVLLSGIILGLVTAPVW